MFERLKRLFRKKTMVKNLTINIDNPICPCNNFDLCWGVDILRSGLHLNVRCANCNTKLLVPVEKLMATIHFDNPYPNMDRNRVASTVKLVKDTDK